MSLDSLSPFQRSVIGGAASGSETFFDLFFFAYKTHTQLKGLKVIKGQFSKDPRVWFAGWRFAVPAQTAMGLVQTLMDRKVDLFLSPHGNPTQLQRVFSSMIGGAIASPMVCPLETILTQMQIQFANGALPKNVNVMGVIDQIYRSYGLAGFTRGTLATAFRDMPYTYGYLKGHELFKPLFNRVTQNDMTAQTLGAFFSAVINATISHPFDVVKTAMQGDMDKKKYTTFTRTWSIIFAETGWRGFFNGLAPRIGRVSFAIFYMNFFIYYGSKGH